MDNLVGTIWLNKDNGDVARVMRVYEKDYEHRCDLRMLDDDFEMSIRPELLYAYWECMRE